MKRRRRIFHRVVAAGVLLVAVAAIGALAEPLLLRLAYRPQSAVVRTLPGGELISSITYERNSSMLPAPRLLTYEADFDELRRLRGSALRISPMREDREWLTTGEDAYDRMIEEARAGSVFVIWYR